MEIREGPVLKAIVTVPLQEGHKGPFFKAESDIGMVTVSLSKAIWQEKDWPDGGIAVLISDIRRKRKGWRAYSARFFRPGDEVLLSKGETKSMEEGEVYDDRRRSQ